MTTSSTQTTQVKGSSHTSASQMTVLNRLDVLEKIMAHHKLYDEFDEQTSRIGQKRQDFADPAVYVFVFGKGKFGKSSLINQLLGRDVAKTSIVPMTWRMDFFRPLSEEDARAAGGEFAEIRRAKSSARERVDIAEAQKLCDEQERDVLKHRRKREREMKQVGAEGTPPEGAEAPSGGLAVGKPNHRGQLALSESCPASLHSPR